MSKWLSRGLAFAALMFVIRVVQGALIDQFETKALLISISLLALFVVVVLIWGLADGRNDARNNPDPDRREDLAMAWLLAGLLAGVVSGVVTWLVSLFYKSLYVGGLINEVTTFAAFTALLVFLPAVLAVAIGRWLVDRKAPPVDRKSASDDDRADTDVFSAVRDDSPTGEIPVAGEQQSHASSVAVAEREESTTAATEVSEGRTEEIPPADRKDT